MLVANLTAKPMPTAITTVCLFNDLDIMELLEIKR
jgi:hypothetical protein